MSLSNHDTINSLSTSTVSSHFIEETLSIYHPEFIYVNNAFMNEDSLHGVIELRPYPFTKEPYLKYVTGPMLLLFLSQVGYVFVRLLSQNKFPQYNIGLSDDEFFLARDNGDIVFTSMKDIKFNRKIWLEESQMTLSLKLNRVLRTKKHSVGVLSFYANEKDIIGTSSVAIIKKHS